MAPRKDDAYLIRFPEGMREQLKADAEAASRTMAAHIVHLLSTHPEGPKAPKRSKARK